MAKEAEIDKIMNERPVAKTYINPNAKYKHLNALNQRKERALERKRSEIIRKEEEDLKGLFRPRINKSKRRSRSN